MRTGLIIAVAGALAATACAPVIRTHGYVPDDAESQLVQANVDSKDTVLQRLGSPSTTGVFEDTWYYISSTREDFAYFKPHIAARRIVAVKFDENEMVTAVNEYDVEDGNEFRMVSRKTPTRGRELSALEQIFGTIGAGVANRLPGGPQDQLPDSAGGPDPYGR